MTIRHHRPGLAAALAAAALALAGCVPPPASSTERQARVAASAELAAMHCDGHAGGPDAAEPVRIDPEGSIAEARAMGASDAELDQARAHMRETFTMAERFRSTRAACDQLIHKIAWHAS